METCTNDKERSTEMLLEHRNAIVYGGGGSVGSPMTAAFANITYGAILD